MVIRSDIQILQDKVDSLGPWWEDIDFGCDIKTGPGRSKKKLWEILGPKIDRSEFVNRTILDLGCNAAGNILELSKSKPKALTGVEGNEKFFKQAEFVVEYFKLNANIINLRFTPSLSPLEYENILGSYDMIFCLGLVYHFNREQNLNLLRYIKANSNKAYFSTQTSTNDNRPLVDWETTREGAIDLFKEAGYSRFEDLYIKSPADDWTALTNTWYFFAS